MLRKVLSAVRRVVDLFRPGSSLLGQAATGGLWLGLLNVLDRLVRMGTLVVLAGLLSPTAFGVVGLAMLSLSVLRRCSQLGLDEALVQHRRDDVDGYLDTTWVLRSVRGVGLAVTAVAIAPFVATVFESPTLEPVIRALAVVPLVTGLRNPGVVYFKKQLEFHREFVYKVSGTVAHTITAIGVAITLGTLWALVWALIASTVSQTIVSYLVHPYRPALSFDRNAAGELVGYGKWIFGSGILVFLLNRVDDALVGLTLGTTALGLYQMAFRFSNAPATEITHVVSRVTFPAFSQAQSDLQTLRDGFFGTVKFVSYVAVPMATGIVLVTPVFVDAFLGPSWTDMILTMQLLAVWAALRAIVSILGPLFRAIDHPEYSTVLQFSRLLVLLVCLYPATTTWGTAGAAVALLVSGGLQNPIALFVAIRQVDGSVWHFLQILTVPVIASALMGAVVWTSRSAFVSLSPSINFVMLVLTGVVAYGGILLIGNRLFDVGPRDELGRLVTALQE
ncbi:lipopolysaccharide biosynthesis protein [Halomicroarcula sp. F13]|uniref:Lipopolysaccharide biosynthesis protein n=1 Tax=Haloarcula rubra TaxID=2487747 RepID=A0AAW4PW54_9EURY|nr:lipopolysaccharide biosynthesis protein [Halomicroarcula rubra]MBX0324344.1 lipopolysaccharide biosynthesis protein [Halomicroarcula rubra]